MERISKSEVTESLKKLGDHYFVESHGAQIILSLYREEDVQLLSEMPFEFKEIHKVGIFPGKYLVVKRKNTKTKERTGEYHVEFTRPQCIDLTKVKQPKTSDGETVLGTWI